MQVANHFSVLLWGNELNESTLLALALLLRWIHIPFGLAGLAVFWIPLVLKKGSLWHRRVGWVFVLCMGVASVTAFGLAIARLLIAISKGPLDLRDLIAPLFLSNVAMLTFTAVHHGISALRLKGKVDARFGLTSVLLPALLLLLSIGSLVTGVIVRNPLLFTLPSVGLFVGSQYLLVIFWQPRERMIWWYQHMSGMIGGCIAAITAANITNSRYLRLWIDAPEWAFWMTPAAIGLPLLLGWQRYYRRKFSQGSSTARVLDNGVDEGVSDAASLTHPCVDDGTK
jgi:uncharacterized membrane protein